MHIVYIIVMVSTNRKTKTTSAHSKEAVKTHKIYNRKNAESFLLQGRFLSQRINCSGFIPLWPQDILWAATAQKDITCQLCNITSLDGPENRHHGLWCAICERWVNCPLNGFVKESCKRVSCQKYSNSLCMWQCHWLFLISLNKAAQNLPLLFVRTSQVFS